MRKPDNGIDIVRIPSRLHTSRPYGWLRRTWNQFWYGLPVRPLPDPDPDDPWDDDDDDDDPGGDQDYPR